MKKNNLLYITTSLMVLSSTVQADNVKVQEDDPEMTCEKLGYTVPVSECLEQGTIPLLCPFATGGQDDERMSLCYSDSCRGFPLWKEDGVYYHLDKNGNKIVAAPETGHIGDYIEGGEAALLSCKTGLASDARTYYKVKKCIDGGILDYDICANGCGKNKYPYDRHPGDLAGAVASCEDEQGEHFGYTSCNDGWYFSDGKCLLSSCSITQFPYTEDPNLINNEYRGETLTCRIGGNIYYRYTSCDESKLDDSGELLYDLKKGVCIRRCELQNCTKTEKTVDGFTYNDWNCDIDSTCRIGDYATYNGKDIGVIVHLKSGAEDKNLVAIHVATGSYKWASPDYESVKIPSLGNKGMSAAKADFNGKLNTLKIIKFTENYGANFPAAAYAYKYNVSCPEGSVCAQYEWYYPAFGEMELLYGNRYILYNATTITRFYSDTFGSSTQSSAIAYYNKDMSTGLISSSVYKSNSGRVLPYLAF